MGRLNFAAVRVGVVAVMWVALVGTSSPDDQGCSPLPLPVVYSLAAGLGGAFDPDTPPPGANNWSCRPSNAHPYPVVLVHGTFANQHANWQTLSPLLYNNGYCVFTFNYGGPPLLGTIYGTNEMAGSAEELSAFVDRVLAATGKSKVDLVGHSQGGVMPHYYIKFLGGAAKVHTFVALAPPNRGTTLAGLVLLQDYIPGVAALVVDGLEELCPACLQQEAGSDFLATLSSGGITVSNVKYTIISSIYDQIVTPWRSQQLSGSNVKNIVIQDQCPIDFDGHAGLAFDHIALQDVLNALDPAHPSTPLCTYIGFETGG